MRPAADVLKFPPIGPLRPAKARLRPDTQAGVKRLIALAPLLGRHNPRSVPAVERVMLNLIGDPPNGGLEHDEALHTTAANGTAHSRRRKAVLVGHADRHVWTPDARLTAVVTEVWDALVHLRVNAR